HSRVAIKASSLNNPTFTEEQNEKLLMTTVGKLIFNEIIPSSFLYINVPTRQNLEIETPDKYFIDKGPDVNEAIQNAEIVLPFQKGIIGDIIAEVFKKYHNAEASI